MMMKKKLYEKPMMKVVKLQQTQMLMTSDELLMINSIDDWVDGGEDNDELTI